MNLLKKQNKFSEIEFMRAISCIMVVIIHVTATFWYSFTPGSFQFKSIILLNTLSKFAVPSFVFISGFVLYYSSIKKDFQILPFYKKRLSKVLIPYITWSILYIIVHYISSNRPIDLLSLAYYFLLGKANYHLYFVTLILQLYLVHPFLLKIFEAIKNKFLAFTLFLLINAFFIKFIKLPFSDRLFPFYLCFYILGFLLADLAINKRSMNKIFPAGILAFYSLFTSYYILDTYKVLRKLPLISKGLYRHSWWYFSFLSILALYIVGRFLKTHYSILTDNKFINSISKCSFTIYLSHPMFMRILHSFNLYKVYQKKAPTILFVAELFGIFIISWILSLILNSVLTFFSKKRNA